MRQYRLEVVAPAEGLPHLLGLFPTRAQAREALRTEWKQWKELEAAPDFRPSLSKLNGKQFLIHTPSGQEIVYRIELDLVVQSRSSRSRASRSARSKLSEELTSCGPPQDRASG